MKPVDISELLGDLVLDAPSQALVVSGIAFKSDAVEPGDAFFCVPGFRHDGHDYAHDAVERGAAGVVAQRHLPSLDVPQVRVADTRIALARAADHYYRHPSRELAVVGITGTNGKTTCTYLLDAILRQAGWKTGMIGTVETRIGSETIPSQRTTPESLELQALLRRMHSSGVRGVSMEVSSHAIDLHRVDDVRFAVAAFTNLTQDHLDYHQTVEEYFSVKKRLFTEKDVGARVVNIDDPHGAGLAAELADVTTVGFDTGADVRAEDVSPLADGTHFVLVRDNARIPLTLPLSGLYNVSNALVAAACGFALGLDAEVIQAGLENAPQVPGRLERVDVGQGFSVFVDYAHTPDSVEKAISAVREGVSGRVIVVFGAGGDRDPEKRPMMGRAAGRVADHVIVTSDNPRTEDPVGIILQIEEGLRETGTSYEVEVDRRRAIARAVAQAAAGDAVLIAGKGHEDYQIFADRTIRFDDREVAREELKKEC